MLKTNTKVEIKKILKSENIRQKDYAESAGVSAAYISEILSVNPIKPFLEKMMDDIGYDIEIKFIKRECLKHTYNDEQENSEAEQNAANEIYGLYRNGELTIAEAMDALHKNAETAFSNMSMFMELLKENGA